MGITPITSLIPLQIARDVQADLEPLPMERVENSASTGDETYSPSNGKPAHGSEDDDSEPDASDDDFSSGTSGDQEDQPSASPSDPTPAFGNSSPISYFA